MQSTQIINEIKKKVFRTNFKELSNLNLLDDNNINKHQNELNANLCNLKKPSYIVLLAFLLGGFGIHRYYVGDFKKMLFFLIPVIGYIILYAAIGDSKLDIVPKIIYIASLFDGHFLSKRISKENYETIKTILKD